MNSVVIISFALAILVIICYTIAMSYIFVGIGQTDDTSSFYNPGYMIGAGVFALAAAVLAALAAPDSEAILPVAIIIGVTALALATGALATGSISH
jgi:hypothetical protein